MLSGTAEIVSAFVFQFFLLHLQRIKLSTEAGATANIGRYGLESIAAVCPPPLSFIEKRIIQVLPSYELQVAAQTVEVDRSRSGWQHTRVKLGTLCNDLAKFRIS